MALFLLSTRLGAQGMTGFSSPPDLLSKQVVVAIIDTGLDLQHEDLRNLIWSNSGEIGLDMNGLPKSSNGIDDDQNGFVDDVHGWDFTNKSNQILDSSGHGTHVAGLIKRGFDKFSQKNSSGLQMMALKYTAGDGKKSRSSFLKALSYAIDKKADVINISASGIGFSKVEFDLLRKAESKGISVVVATGNKKPGSPNYRSFPASYHLSNITAVAAVDQHGQILPTSNQIDKKNVHYAVGENLISSLPGNHRGKKTGTSQATALVSGHMAARLALGQSESTNTRQM